MKEVEELQESNKIVKVFNVFLSFLVPIFIYFTSWVFLDTLESLSLMKKYAIIGALIVAAIFYVFYRNFPNYIDFRHKKRRNRMITNYICLVICFIYGAAFLNYFTSMGNIHLKQVKVIKKAKNHRYGDRYLYIKIDNYTKQFQPSYGEWYYINEGETIWVSIGKGCLGYECVSSFNVNSPSKNS